MSFKSSYIYTLILLAFIIFFRENFDFTLGDREAFFTSEGWRNFSIRNFIAIYIFSNLKYFGEVLFCILYYKNVFKLSSLLFRTTRIKDFLNKRIVYYSILLSLFAPVTIIFTSFAGKDILGIFLASELCIELINYKNQKNIPKLNLVKIIIYFVLLFLLRKISAILLTILLVIFLVLINKKYLSILPLVIITISIFSIIFFWNQIYDLVYQEFYYQWNASQFDDATLSGTNPFFTLEDFVLNSYQMFTSIAMVHFSESFLKASLLLLNSFLTNILTISLSLIYFWKNLKIKNLFLLKGIFLVLFFVINGFLSQNNPGGAIRYMSSAVPIFTTFIFAILPE